MSVATFCKKKYPWRKIGCNRNIPWVLRGEKLDGRKITDFHKLIGKMRSRKVRVNSYHCACALLLTLELKPFWSWIYILIIKNVQCGMSMTSWLIHTLFTALKLYGSTKTKKGMDRPRRHWRSTLCFNINDMNLDAVLSFRGGCRLI